MGNEELFKAIHGAKDGQIDEDEFLGWFKKADKKVKAEVETTKKEEDDDEDEKEEDDEEEIKAVEFSQEDALAVFKSLLDADKEEIEKDTFMRFIRTYMK